MKDITATFLYQVNLNYLSNHFKEFAEPQGGSPYWQYVSKNFYGAVIRSKISLVSLDLCDVVVNVRLKGRTDRRQTVTGIKMDFIGLEDPRIEEYGLIPEDLTKVSIEVDPNIPGNIILDPQPALATAFFYKRRDGSSIIRFVGQN